MDGGRILDQGRHNDLMTQNERYSSLIHTFLHEDAELVLNEADCDPVIEGKPVSPMSV